VQGYGKDGNFRRVPPHRWKLIVFFIGSIWPSKVTYFSLALE
jgi:hypothetical protein